MEWTHDEAGERWYATGRDGTDWEIIRSGDRYGVIIARWDHPDWWAESLEDAKALAEERDAAPPIPREEWVTEARIFSD